MVTHQLQVERRTAKGHRPKTDALPLDHTTNLIPATIHVNVHMKEIKIRMMLYRTNLEFCE